MVHANYLLTYHLIHITYMLSKRGKLVMNIVVSELPITLYHLIHLTNVLSKRGKLIMNEYSV